jgi:hypothetical protein
MRLPWRRGAGDGADATDVHARARSLSLQALDNPLEPAEAAWLSDHLQGCLACQAAAAGFDADRQLLRSLRDREPTPPRDLWARTSAAIEREAARDAGRSSRRAVDAPAAAAGGTVARTAGGYRQAPRTSALKSILVILIALAATSLVNRVMPVPPSPSEAVASGRGATPIPVSAKVGWLQTGTDGTYDLILTTIDQVCPSDDASACEPVQDKSRGSISLGARPRSVSLSPDAAHLVVISSAATAGGSVVVVNVPTPRPSAPAAGSSGPTVTLPPATPVATAQPSGDGSPLPSALASILPGGSASPTAAPGTMSIADAVVVVGGTAGYSPDGQWFAFSARPADGSAGPDIYVWRVGDPRAEPVTTDHRSVFSSWIGNRILGSRVDEPGRPVRPPTPATSPTPSTAPAAAISLTAASSPLASTTPSESVAPSPPTPSPSTPSPTAGPTASTVPNGTPEPRRTPEASGSPVPSSPAGGQRFRNATSFLLDPATHAVEEVPGNLWRPVVDPSGRWVVYWDGTLVADGVDWQPANGSLVVAPWSSPGAAPAASTTPAASGVSASPRGTVAPGAAVTPAGGSGTSPGPSHSAGPAATTRPSGGSSDNGGSGSGSARPDRSAAQHAVVDGPLVDFDAQFDPSGRFLAVWVANPTEPTSGFLTLYAVDAATGTVEPAHAPLVALPALRGFSIGAGRLAWVSPPSAGGTDSRIEIIGWTDSGFGTVESLPAESLLVVR